MNAPGTGPTGLRRELGSLASYALLLGILVGAGIFSVTADAGAIAGPSVILGDVVLAPVVLASAVAYVVFLSTPLGLQPGGELLHIDRTFGRPTLTFVGAWLKCVSYLGAAAYLADALAHNTLALCGTATDSAAAGRADLLVAIATIALFWFVHTRSVRWLGRLQIAMCLVLAVALLVLIVPGLFATECTNLQPFFAGGLAGFASALPLLFFAYAGFESLAHSAGEVRDCQQRLPAVFVRGILITTVLFVTMAIVAFGVLPPGAVGASRLPMSDASAVYLGAGGRAFVTIGAVLAIATSLNATLLVPARLWWVLANERRLPRAFARLHARHGTPAFGVTVSALVVVLLLVSDQRQLALRIATTALMALYALHSLALVMLPRANPELWRQVRTRLPRRWQLLAAWASLAALLTMLAIQFGGDLRARCADPWRGEITTLELLLGWTALGLVAARACRPAV